MIQRTFIALVLAAATTGALVGCSSSAAPRTETDRQALAANAQAALSRFRAEDLSLEGQLRTAHAYAIFPDVGKGGLGLGGAYGRGEVWQGGSKIGFADMTQATIGLQAGGQTFSQLILFENAAALDRFKTGKLNFTANVSAVAVQSGAAAAAKYTDGVIVFVRSEGGLMAEAALGGQQFTFSPAP